MKPGQLPWKWLLFGLLAVLLFGISLIPWLIGDTSRFSARVADALSAWTGGQVKFTGPVQVSFLPDVSIRGPLQMSGGENLPLVKSMTVKEAKISLDLVDLLRGQVSIDVLRLQKPKIKLKDGSIAAPRSVLDGLLAGAPMRVLLVRNGRIDLELFPIKDFYLRLDAGEETGALSGAGSFVYKGETVRYAVETGAPTLSADSRSMPIRLAIESSQIAAKIAGTASFTDSYKLDGQMDANIGNLRSFLNWVNFDLPPGESLQALSLAGTLHLGDGSLGLENGNFSLDGNKAVGVLAVSIASRPRIDGTFAFDSLSLTPFLGKSDGAMLDEALLRYFDADLRISGGEIVLGPFNLGKGAFTVSAKDGSVTTEVGELELCGGSAEGRVNMNLAQAAKELSVSADLADVALDACLKPFGLEGQLTGTGAIKAELASKGKSLPEITRNLSGTVVVNSRNGTLPLDIAKLSATPTPPESKGWQATGDGSYDKLKAECRLARGRIVCRNVKIDTPRESIVGAGQVDLPKRTLDWKLAVIKLAGPASAPSAPSESKPKVSIRGSLRQPVIRRTDGAKEGTGNLPARASGEQVTPH